MTAIYGTLWHTAARRADDGRSALTRASVCGSRQPSPAATTHAGRSCHCSLIKQSANLFLCCAATQQVALNLQRSAGMAQAPQRRNAPKSRGPPCSPGTGGRTDVRAEPDSVHAGQVRRVVQRRVAAAVAGACVQAVPAPNQHGTELGQTLSSDTQHASCLTVLPSGVQAC